MKFQATKVDRVGEILSKVRENVINRADKKSEPLVQCHFNMQGS